MTKQTELFDIPFNWQARKLGDISQIIVPMRDKPKKFDGNIPWIRIEDFEGKYVYRSKSGRCVSQDTIEKMNLKPYPKGTVLCSCSGNMGICAITGSVLVSNQTFAGIVPQKEIDSEYLYYLLSYYKYKLQSIGSGTTIAYISRDKFENLLIPVPPLREQKEIDSILSNIDELIEKTGQIIEMTQRLKKGLMQSLLTKGIGHTKFKKVDFNFGRSLSIPETWNLSRIRDVIESIQSGFASGERDENGITQLRMNNITDDGNFDFSKLLKVPIPEDIKRYDIKNEDILFNNTNSLDLIGKSVIANSNLPYTFSNHITRIRTNNKIINPYYMFLVLLRYKEEYVFRSICNTHVGQSGIGKNELTNLLICYPNLDEQRQISRILILVDEKIRYEKEYNQGLQNIKDGLMANLLTGTIRVPGYK